MTSSGDVQPPGDPAIDAPLKVAQDAAAAAERRAGDLHGELTLAEEKLAAALSAQQEWDRLFAEQADELRQCRERLEALETSTTWRLTQRALAPYRLLRERLGR